MSSEDGGNPGRPTRRAVLGGIGLGAGAALAGCTTILSRTADGDNGDRVEELEREVAELTAENAALREEVATLERDVDRYRSQLDAGNLWGFDRDTMASLQSVARAWTDSVVAIDAITADGVWAIGTGWVYDDGIVVSNAHVLEPRRLPGDETITRYDVWDQGGHRVTGTLRGLTFGEDAVFDRREDIGFLEVPDSMTEGRVADRGASRALEADDPLVQIGHPYSLDYWTASVGPFLGHREPFFATNVPGQPGVSGAPILDVDGDLVGMTWGGQYVRRPERQPGEVPMPGDGRVMPAFETAVNGLHSYVHRIETAADALL